MPSRPAAIVSPCAQSLDLVAVERGGEVADGVGGARAEAEQIGAVHADQPCAWPAGVVASRRMREQLGLGDRMIAAATVHHQDHVGLRADDRLRRRAACSRESPRRH